MVSGSPQIAMWFGFALAAYSAIANDSIQTLAHSRVKLKRTCGMVIYGGIFTATTLYSWWNYGDVSPEAPLERLRCTKVSSSACCAHLLTCVDEAEDARFYPFLLLSCLPRRKRHHAMTSKNLGGYVIAFILSVVIWYALGPDESSLEGKASRFGVPFSG